MIIIGDNDERRLFVWKCEGCGRVEEAPDLPPGWMRVDDEGAVACDNCGPQLAEAVPGYSGAK